MDINVKKWLLKNKQKQKTKQNQQTLRTCKKKQFSINRNQRFDILLLYYYYIRVHEWQQI